MKKSVKRAVSVLLAVLTLSFCFGVFALAAGNAANDYEPICPVASNGRHNWRLSINNSCLERENENAYIVEYCTYCNQTRKTEYATPRSHTPQVVPKTPATCYATGLTEGVVCSVCGKVLEKQSEIAKLGHTDKDDDGWCDLRECNAELRYHCPYCNKEHAGFFGGIAKFFHNMLYQLQGLFRF